MLDHRYGQGRVIYLGTRLDRADMRELIGPLLGQQPAVPAGVERVVRTAGPVSYEFLLNHSGIPVSVPAAPGGTDLLTGTAVGEHLDLPPQASPSSAAPNPAPRQPHRPRASPRPPAPRPAPAPAPVS